MLSEGGGRGSGRPWHGLGHTHGHYEGVTKYRDANVLHGDVLGFLTGLQHIFLSVICSGSGDGRLRIVLYLKA